MTAERPVLLRFVLLYCALFGAFGCVSPFLPAFLTGRGLEPEELGVVLGGATALRLVCGPIAGRIADRLHAFRAELGLCAILAKEDRTERLQIMVDADELAVIDDFRFKSRMPSRAAAVRELLRRGLASAGRRNGDPAPSAPK